MKLAPFKEHDIAYNSDNGADAQDGAEIFDETNITRDGDDIAHPDMARDVFDVTAESGDADDFAAGDEDFDPDLADEAEIEAELDLGDGVDEPRELLPDDADRVTTDDASPADYQGGEEDGDDNKVESPPENDAHVDKQLDHGLKETFPASDPVSINPGAD